MRRIYGFGLFIYPYDRQHGVSVLSLSLHCVRYQIEFNSIFRLRHNAISNNNARHPKTKTQIASAVAIEKRRQQRAAQKQCHLPNNSALRSTRFYEIVFRFLLATHTRYTFYFVSFGWFMVSNTPLQRFSFHPKSDCARE